MTKWIERLSVAQKIFLRTFFMIMGLVLLVVVFYAGGREMLLLSEPGEQTKWTTIHWIFSFFGLVFITLSIWLTKITKLFDLGTGFFSKFTGTRKGGDNA